MKLKIGEIAYANTFPIFYMLRKECDCSDYEFVEGVPSELNSKIRNGEIDISISSSIEYLRNPDIYEFIDGHSISSEGPIGSILLFSKIPIEALDKETILVSYQSETSIALLQVILKKFYDIDCTTKISRNNITTALKNNIAYMLIGDDALIEALKWPKLYIYDLGDIWYRHTSLPFTFALWIVRKSCINEKSALLKKFCSDLNHAKKTALKMLEKISSEVSLKKVLSKEELIAYWQGISYDFAKKHKKGIELFRQYLIDINKL